MTGEWLWIVGLSLTIVGAVSGARLNLRGLMIFSLVGGVLISLVTMRPLPWVIQLVLPPEYSPWRVDMVALLLDITVWSLLLLVIGYTVKRRIRKP